MNPTQKPQIPEVIKGLNSVIKSHQNQIAVWASLEEAVRMAGGALTETVRLRNEASDYVKGYPKT